MTPGRAMPLSPGTTVGIYEIVNLIGAGGMGEVYRARDSRLRRDVAIKVLTEVFRSDAERLSRLQREAVALASLNHPHIAAIFGIEESEGIHALVLELVEGPTLADRIATGRLSLEETCVIALQIADALAASHERGIVHRDLKPANVKIRRDGTVKVLDFGLAKITSNDLQAAAAGSTLANTHDGMILGTTAYMSPEQARGGQVDNRADIWAFGCVVYEMLTGERAFDGQTISDTIAAILTREPAWERLPRATPQAIRLLLRRTLKKDPQRRLHHIADATLELEDVLEGTSDGEERSSPLRDVEFQRLTDFVGLKECPAISPDGKMIAFVALVRGRRQLWLRLLAGGPSLQLTHDDVDHEQPRWAPDSSTLIYYTPARHSTEAGAIWEISAFGGAARRIGTAVGGGDISHDGRRIALFQASVQHIDLVTIARDGSQRQHVLELPSDYLYRSPRWSRDDKSIAFQRDSLTFTNCLEIVAAAGGPAREVARSEWLAGFSWLPDNSGLVYSSSRGSTLLYPPIYNLRTVEHDGPDDHQLTYGDRSYLEPDVHGSGKILVSRIRSDSDVWKIPITGSPTQNTRNRVRITRQTGQVQTPCVSPDGSEIAYLSDNGGHGNLWIAKLDGTAARQITYERDPSTSIGIPQWSPDGNWIVFLLTRGWQSSLWLIQPDGSGLREVVPNGWGPCWSDDGRWIFYSRRHEGRPHLDKVSVDGGEPHVVLRENVLTAAVARGGETIYYVRGLTTELLGIVGDLEIRRSVGNDKGSELIGRVAGSRVPVSPRLVQLFLSPDGQWLALPLTDGGTSNIWALPTSGGALKPITDFSDRSVTIARSVSWSADSQFLYAAVAETEIDIVLLDGLIR